MRGSLAVILCLVVFGSISRADELADITRVCGKPVQIIEEPNQGLRLWRSMVFEPAPGHQVRGRFFALSTSGPWYYEWTDLDGLLSDCRHYRAQPGTPQGVLGQPFQDSEGMWHRDVALDCQDAEKHLLETAPKRDGPWAWDSPIAANEAESCQPAQTEQTRRAQTNSPKANPVKPLEQNPTAAEMPGPSPSVNYSAEPETSPVPSLVLLALLALVYFLPAVIAKQRGCKATAGIVIVDIFLGWTFVGWVVALAWAASGESGVPQVNAVAPCPVCGAQMRSADELRAHVSICALRPAPPVK